MDWEIELPSMDGYINERLDVCEISPSMCFKCSIGFTA